MANYIDMPKLSDTMTEGTLVKWRKNPGDRVEIGDIIAEVETDKATMEMEAFDEGTLAEVYVKEGEKVAVGQRLGLLLAEGEEKPASVAPAPVPGQTATPDATASAPASAPAAPSRTAPAVANDRVKASPLARKIASAKGVDLSRVLGTGPGGRIVARDVENTQAAPSPLAGRAAPPAPSKPSAAPVPTAARASATDAEIPLTGMRRVIAERLLASKTQIPHFYLSVEADAAPLMKLRAEANTAAEASGGQKLTVNDFVLKAAIAAATRVPAVNASFAGDRVIQFADINLAVAVAVDDGLVTPVIRAAQSKSIREISAAVKDLAARARNKKLKPEEYQGGTITVSNLGAYGIENFYAIINPPQSLILAVGAVVKKPVVGPGDQIIVGQRVALGLSADHRVVDGAVGAQYLAELKKLIENPALMLL